jgi:hypothetical protein
MEIPGSYIRADGSVTVGGFKHSGFRLQGTGPITILHRAEFTSGVIEINLNFAPTAVVTLTGSQNIYFGNIIENQGLFIWQGTGGCQFGGGAFNNRAGGIFDIQTDAPIYSPQGAGLPPSAINNFGVFRKSAGTGVTTIGGPSSVPVQINNSARAEVLVGRLNIGSGGTSSGEFFTQTGATLEFSNADSTYTFNNGSRFSGTGAWRGTGGNLVMNGGITSSGFELVAGRLGGNFTLLGSMVWTDGRMISVNITIPASSEFRMSGAAQKWLQSSAFNNDGRILFEGAGPLVLRQSAINNNAAGILDVRSDAAILSPQGEGLGPSSINNAGVFRKSASVGETLIGGQNSVPILFNNSGRMDVKSGVMNLGSGAAGNGIFFTEMGTKILFSNGACTFNNAAAFQGDGSWQGVGATLTMNGSISSDGFELLSGELNGDFTLNGKFTWLGGSMARNSGKMTVASGSVVTIAGSQDKVLNYGGQIDNLGTIVWDGAGQFVAIAPTINNRVGALFEMRSDARLVNPQGGGFPPGVFNNFGTVRKANGFGTSRIGGPDSVPIAFNNYGTMEIRSGALVLSSYAGSAESNLAISLSGETPLTQFGQLQVLETASLNGKIIAILAPGYHPPAGQTFQVLKATPRNGTFAQVITEPQNSGALLAAIYEPTAVLLSVGALRPAIELSTLRYSAGAFHLNITGSIGQSYVIEATTDFSSWNPIATNTFEQSLWQFIDPSVLPYRFYRARLQ